MNERDTNEVTPHLEAKLASELRELLAGTPIGAEFTVDPSSAFCSSLEYALPRLLRRRHAEWTKESLDGVFVAFARKTGPAAIQLAGTCILITDQTVTPLLLDLTLSSAENTVKFFRLYLGEPGEGQLGISGPECNSREAKEMLITLTTRLNNIPWSYKISSETD